MREIWCEPEGSDTMKEINNSLILLRPFSVFDYSIQREYL